MHKVLVFSLLISFILACAVIPNDEGSFEEKAGTQVAVALTATALDVFFAATETSSIQATAEPSPEPTESPQTDPKADLGDNPTYRDNGTSWSAWSVETVDQVLEGVTTVKVADGALSMQSSQTGKFHWWLNYRELDDGYLEAKFDVGNCAGSDQYGLVFRAPDYFNGVGYYFTLTCDGHYDLREKDDPNSLIQNNQMRFGMPQNGDINTGSNQTNMIGIRMKGDTIRLYINGQYVNEITDAKLTSTGHFGPFIYAQNTAGFKISLDEISYWLFEKE